MIRRGTVSIRSEVQALKETLSKANYVLEAIRQVLVKMSRLEESIIDAGVREPPLKPFLLTVGPVIGSNLRSLTLHSSMDLLSTCAASPRMERLKELQLLMLIYHESLDFEHSQGESTVSLIAPGAIYQCRIPVSLANSVLPD